MAQVIEKYECKDCGRFFYAVDSRGIPPSVECRKCGEDSLWVPKERAPYVSSDIQPYKSQVTGEMITSRSQHRDHMRQHKMIEVGNEKLEPPKVDKTAENKKRKQEIADTVNALTI